MDLNMWLRSFGEGNLGNDEEAPSLDALKEEEYPSVPIKLSDADIDQAIRRFSLVVVDCWAPWCGPCRMVAPVIEALAKDYAGKIVFGKLNVDENPQTAMKHMIRSIPSLLVFHHGQNVDIIIGAQPREMLEPQITQYLGVEG